AGQFDTFDWSGVGRTDGKQAGEFSPIFYNSRRFEKLDNGTFWLSKTPDTPSRGWDAALPRIVSWVRLEERDSGTEFYFFNTHFDHRGEKARRESAGLILRKIGELAGESVPVIVTGDFNAAPDSDPYSVLTAELRDAMKVSLHPHYGPEATFLAEGGPFNVGSGKEGRRIDYIFVNERVEVKHHGIIGTFREGRFPSDHLPVVAEVRL
ncbi:MAG: endonuclease/exonuclease/phosphatase family protein, partial [Balneolaceae bacterium]|nr:endonuclease/exonuclease/phosphatase family protein [Balneolaceae bacterium]